MAKRLEKLSSVNRDLSGDCMGKDVAWHASSAMSQKYPHLCGDVFENAIEKIDIKIPGNDNSGMYIPKFNNNNFSSQRNPDSNGNNSKSSIQALLRQGQTQLKQPQVLRRMQEELR